jgi:hypothetical protein
VAACIRDSGHEDQELSALHQERTIREWCAQYGYTLTRIFTDTKSGKTASKRVEFQAMMTYFRQPSVPEAGVVVWSYSRFARNALEAQYYRSELKQHGKILYSITEPVPTGPEAIIIEAAYDFAHQKYLDDLSDNVVTGLRDLVAIHGCLPGYPPKGFMRSDPIVTGHHRDGTVRTGHRWIPDPNMIPIVQKAFQMRLVGASYGQIHIETHLFNTINCYNGLFKNKLYIGILEYGDLVIEDYCTPMIDQATWAGVQKVQSDFSIRRNIHLRAHHPRRIAGDYILSGIVSCMRCGAQLAGHTSQVDGKAYRSYICIDSKNRRTCDLRQIPCNPLENAVIDQLEKYVLQPEVMAVMLEEGYQSEKEQKRTLGPQINQLKRKIRKVDTQINNLIRAITISGHSTALLNELKTQETTKAELSTQLAGIEYEAARRSPELSMDQIRNLCEATSITMREGDASERRRILQGLIKNIAVDRVENEIHGVIEFFEPLPTGSKIVPTHSAPGEN